jgi:hypothetical protein
MIPFIERFPALGARETRSVTVTNRDDLPDGDYGFIELYCDEPHCDCRRVIVVVLRPETGANKPWATISYGWESEEFYEKRAGEPAGDQTSWQGPYLETMGTQSRYAPALMDLFKFLLQSPDYLQRLKRHYQLFRGTVEKDSASSNSQQPPSPLSKSRRDRDRSRLPRGSK